MGTGINTRTHCDCGHPMDPVQEAGGNWGSWRCRKCWTPYCQDCGSVVGEGDQCLAYLEEKEQEQRDYSY